MNELIADILGLVLLTAGSAVPGVVAASAKDDAIESVGRRASVGVDEFDGACTFPGDSGLA